MSEVKSYLYYYPDTDDLETAVKKFFSLSEENLKFVFILTKEQVCSPDFEKECDKVIEKLQSHTLLANEIYFAVDTKDHSLDQQEWERMKAAEKYANLNGVTFGFTDEGSIFTTQEVETANSNITAVADKANSNNFSPLEKLLYVEMCVTSREYTYENEEESSAQSRSVYGLLNSDRIVCAGYANWFKAIVDEIGDENIEIYPNIVMTRGEPHANLIAHIKDAKYGIDGYYYFDPTWDGKKHDIGGQMPSLVHFLVPIKDLDKMSGDVIEAKDYVDRWERGRIDDVRTNSKRITVEKKFAIKTAGDAVSLGKDGFEPSKEFMEQLAERAGGLDEARKFIEKTVLDEREKSIERLEGLNVFCELQSGLEYNLPQSIVELCLEGKIGRNEIKDVQEALRMKAEMSMGQIPQFVLETFSLQIDGLKSQLNVADVAALELLEKVLPNVIDEIFENEELKRNILFFDESSIEYYTHIVNPVLQWCIECKSPSESYVLDDVRAALIFAVEEIVKKCDEEIQKKTETEKSNIEIVLEPLDITRLAHGELSKHERAALLKYIAEKWSNPISREVIEEALGTVLERESTRFNSVNPKALAHMIVDANENLAKAKFTADATNCFRSPTSKADVGKGRK